MLIVAVVAAVSVALLVGALWGAYGPVPDLVRGNLFALAAGALITSLSFELLQPAAEQAGNLVALSALAAGAAVFTGIDYLIDEVWDGDGGGLGILAAVTLDGVPENLALGVALIGASVGEVGALAVSIMLSNLPEAAGGADNLVEQGWSRGRTVGLWSMVGVLLAGATVLGNLTLAGVPEEVLSAIRTFAAGAVLASLATEVLPQAFADARHWAGIAITVGMITTFLLSG